MTYYETGFGKPPKAHRFKKGQSGNPAGRKKKPPPTLAKCIEEEWLAPITISEAGVPRQSTGLELILLHLIAMVSKGSSTAHRVLRKYEAFAKTSTRTLYFLQDGKAGIAAYEASLDGREYNGPKAKALTRMKTKDLPMNARVALMKAGLEPHKIMEGMTLKQAQEIYDLTLHLMPEDHSLKTARRRKTRKLTAGEIFDKAINSPVTLHAGKSRVTLPRLQGSIKVLVMTAAKGNIKCADQLANLHAASTKYGDFVLQERRKIIDI